MTETQPRSLYWWDEIDAPAISPSVPKDHLVEARDRLSLAATIQSASGGDVAITVRLGGWCLDLQRGQVSLAGAMAVLQGLDRLDRQACEPRTWQHLEAAEMAIAAYVAQLSEG
jgi:hypothetical protein